MYPGFVMVLVSVPSPTVSVTVYVPAAVYVCVGLASVLVAAIPEVPLAGREVAGRGVGEVHGQRRRAARGGRGEVGGEALLPDADAIGPVRDAESQTTVEDSHRAGVYVTVVAVPQTIVGSGFLPLAAIGRPQELHPGCWVINCAVQVAARDRASVQILVLRHTEAVG